MLDDFNMPEPIKRREATEKQSGRATLVGFIAFVMVGFLLVLLWVIFPWKTPFLTTYAMIGGVIYLIYVGPRIIGKVEMWVLGRDD